MAWLRNRKGTEGGLVPIKVTLYKSILGSICLPKVQKRKKTESMINIEVARMSKYWGDQGWEILEWVGWGNIKVTSMRKYRG